MLVKFGLKKKIGLGMTLVLIMLMMCFQTTGFTCNYTNIALEKPVTCERCTNGHEASAANDKSMICNKMFKSLLMFY